MTLIPLTDSLESDLPAGAQESVVVALDALDSREDAAWWAAGWAYATGRRLTVRVHLALAHLSPDTRPDALLRLDGRLADLHASLAVAYPHLNVTVEPGFVVPDHVSAGLRPGEFLAISGDGGPGSLLDDSSIASWLAHHSPVPTVIVPHASRQFELGPVGILPIAPATTTEAIRRAKGEAERLGRPVVKLPDSEHVPAFVVIARPPQAASTVFLPSWQAFREAVGKARWAILVMPPDNSDTDGGPRE